MVVTKLGYVYSIQDSINNNAVKGELTDYEDGYPMVTLSMYNQDNATLVHSHYSRDQFSNEFGFSVAATDPSNVSAYACALLQLSQNAISSLDDNNENNENNEEQ